MTNLPKIEKCVCGMKAEVIPNEEEMMSEAQADVMIDIATISPGDGFNAMTIPLEELEMTLQDLNDGDDSDPWVVKLGRMRRSELEALPEHMGF